MLSEKKKFFGKKVERYDVRKRKLFQIIYLLLNISLALLYQLFRVIKSMPAIY